MKKDILTEFLEEAIALSIRLGKDIAEDLKNVMKEFANSAFILDDETNNSDIWLDLYKPFGNGNIYGDVMDIVTYFDDDDDDEAEDDCDGEDMENDYHYAKLLYLILPYKIRYELLGEGRKFDAIIERMKGA
jgi:hypothetical protein